MTRSRDKRKPIVKEVQVIYARAAKDQLFQAQAPGEKDDVCSVYVAFASTPIGVNTRAKLVVLSISQHHRTVCTLAANIRVGAYIQIVHDLVAMAKADGVTYFNPGEVDHVIDQGAIDLLESGKLQVLDAGRVQRFSVPFSEIPAGTRFNELYLANLFHQAELMNFGVDLLIDGSVDGTRMKIYTAKLETAFGQSVGCHAMLLLIVDGHAPRIVDMIQVEDAYAGLVQSLLTFAKSKGDSVDEAAIQHKKHKVSIDAFSTGRKQPKLDYTQLLSL